MDKRFFKNRVLHIPHRLRDLLWMASSIAPIFFFSSYGSSFFFFPESTKSNHFHLAHIPRMNESHDPGRLFKVAIFTSSFTYFLRSFSDVCSFLQIAWSNNQTSLSVSLGKTLVIQFDPWLNQQWSSWPWWSSSCVRLLSLISLWNWNLSTHVGVQFIFFREIIYFYAWKLWASPIWCDISLWNENFKWK